MNIEDFVKPLDGMEEIPAKQEYADYCALSAKNILTASIDSKELAAIINEVSALVGLKCTVEYGDSGLLLAQMSGALKTYSHTVVMMVIGILIDHEIL